MFCVIWNCFKYGINPNPALEEPNISSILRPFRANNHSVGSPPVGTGGYSYLATCVAYEFKRAGSVLAIQNVG